MSKWRVAEAPAEQFTVWDGDRLLAIIVNHDDEILPDARLMAAAPELLEICELAKEILYELPDGFATASEVALENKIDAVMGSLQDV